MGPIRRRILFGKFLNFKCIAAIPWLVHQIPLDVTTNHFGIEPTYREIWCIFSIIIELQSPVIKKLPLKIRRILMRRLSELFKVVSAFRDTCIVALFR